MMSTVVVYHIDDEETPYRTKLSISTDQATLADLKSALNLPRNYKFFFKTNDAEYGIVKEEISDDRSKLPLLNGRIEAWLVTADGSSHSDPTPNGQNQNNDPHKSPRRHLGNNNNVRNAGTGDVRPPSFHGGRHGDSRDPLDQSACTSETESTISGLPKFPRHGSKLDRRSYRPQYYDRTRMPHHRHRSVPVEGSSTVTSDLDTTSFVDSDDDQASRVSTSTDITSVSRQHLKNRKKKRRPRQLMSRASSVSSITESSLSLNIITVTLNMEPGHFLGISIVGHSNQLGGDGGIFVGSIMKGGAVALDGRIQPGDMILQVNETSFDNMTNDDAVAVLRDAVSKAEPIKLVVTKMWDSTPKSYFTLPRTEPIRPIDPGAWVAHTNALRQESPLDHPRPSSVSTNVSNNSGSFTSSLPDSDKYFADIKLDVNVHDIQTVAKAMARPDSGLEVKTRTWLKITIPNAFLGSELVDWLHSHVQGFADRKDARKYANRLLKEGYIRHTVNKITFSDQCYYVFGDICGNFAAMRLDGPPHEEYLGQADHDGVAPLLPPPPSTPSPWPSAGGGGGSCLPLYPPPPFVPTASIASGYAPVPFQYSSMMINSCGGGGGMNEKPAWNNAGFIEKPACTGGGAYSSLNSFAVSQSSNTAGGGFPSSARSDVNSSLSGGSGGSSGSDGRKQKKLLNPSPLVKDNIAKTSGGVWVDTVGDVAVDSVSRPMVSTGQQQVPPPPPDVRALDQVPPEIAGSRQSFRMAMANPHEVFVDVM